MLTVQISSLEQTLGCRALERSASRPVHADAAADGVSEIAPERARQTYRPTELTDAERAALLKRSRSRTLAARVVLRSRIVLLASRRHLDVADRAPTRHDGDHGGALVAPVRLRWRRGAGRGRTGPRAQAVDCTRRDRRGSTRPPGRPHRPGSRAPRGHQSGVGRAPVRTRSELFVKHTSSKRTRFVRQSLCVDSRHTVTQESNRGHTMMRSQCTQVTVALMVLSLGLLSTAARASSFSQSIINGPTSASSSDPLNSSVVVGGNSANSFVNPLTETMGAFVASDGSAFSVSAQSSHADDWCFPALCAAALPFVHVEASIGFDAVVGGDMAAGGSGLEFSLLAQYFLGPMMSLRSARARTPAHCLSVPASTAIRLPCP